MRWFIFALFTTLQNIGKRKSNFLIFSYFIFFFVVNGLFFFVFFRVRPYDVYYQNIFLLISCHTNLSHVKKKKLPPLNVSHISIALFYCTIMNRIWWITLFERKKKLAQSVGIEYYIEMYMCILFINVRWFSQHRMHHTVTSLKKIEQEKCMFWAKYCQQNRIVVTHEVKWMNQK